MTNVIMYVTTSRQQPPFTRSLLTTSLKIDFRYSRSIERILNQNNIRIGMLV